MNMPLSLVATGVAAVIPALACAQTFPSRPIRLIVPAAAGSATDIAARNVAIELSRAVSQQVVVDNRPGASGIIGNEMIARAAPDGYTLGYITNTFTANVSLHAKLPYDSIKDFTPLMLGSSSPNLLAITPSLPYRSLKELIEFAKAKPAALSFGSGGSGSSQHLAMELVKLATGTNMVHVAYKGSQQAVTDVIGGQIHMICDAMASILPHVKGGRIRGIAITSLKRSHAVSDLPTFDEAGIPGYEVTNWGGYVLPARVASSIVMQLNSSLNNALMSPSVSKLMIDRGATPRGGTPEFFGGFIRTEIDKWGKVVRAAGIKPL